MTRTWIRAWVLGAGLAILLGGCGLFSGEEEDKTANWSAEKLYSSAEDEIAQGGWTQAGKYLQQLQQRFPFGRYAQQALMEECYVQWKDGENEQALSACDKFIKQYPNSVNTDYVYYLRGLINFNGDLGLFGQWTDQDLSERDPKGFRDSFDSFRELVTRFPQSRYVPDANLRMHYLVDTLAHHEIHVAAYYLRRGAYIAAVDRAKGVILNFQSTPEVEDALEILVVAYDHLNEPQLRDDARHVLALNYPEHVPGKFNPPVKHWWKFW